MKHTKCPYDHTDCSLPAECARLEKERAALQNLVSTVTAAQ